MRIGLATELDVHRRDCWSGTPLYMANALRAAGSEVTYLGPIQQSVTVSLTLLGKVLRRSLGSDPMFNRYRLVARAKAGTLRRALQRNPVDVVYAPAGSTLISEFHSSVPVVYCSDVTLRLMFNYYDRYKVLSDSQQARAIAAEEAAMLRSALLLFPTEWAARSAIEEYRVDPAKVFVQPFGANLLDPPSRSEAIRNTDDRITKPLQLLFCGAEWNRKGGDTALRALEILRERGVDAHLTILGCAPPSGAIESRNLQRAVTVVRFLRKSDPADAARFKQVFLESDVLILPTSAECYGLVFCEAAAFGTISIATRTGGVPEVIRHEHTGYTMPIGADETMYADCISGLASNRSRLTRMKVAAREDFDMRLNWKVWADNVLPRIERLSERIGLGARG